MRNERSGQRPHVVIVGGGFGGFSAAYELERLAKGTVESTLVSGDNSMTYTPFLPQAASGTLEPRHVVVPLRRALRRTRLLVGAAAHHDREHRTIGFRSESGEEHELPYDQLILAPGSVSRTAPVPGLSEAAVGFKTLAQAIHLRNHVLKRLEAASVTADPRERQAQLTFVFVGGGYAGVEALAELEDLVRDALAAFPDAHGLTPRWVLVEATESIFPEVGSRLASYALRQLVDRGIEVRMGALVEDARGGVVTLPDGERIPTRTLVWTAGVRPSPTGAALGMPLDERGRIRVDETMHVAGMPGVWAVGDSAAIPDPARPGLTCPPTSQHAVRQGRLVAANVLAHAKGAPARPFRYRTRGIFVDLGRHKAVASIFGLQFSGLLAWLFGRSYHLGQVPGLARKGRIAADWTVGLFFRRDTAELGTLGRPQPLDER
jgi:NADH dehydrogenase